MTTILLLIFGVPIICLIGVEVYKYFNPEEDVYSNKAIQIAKQRNYPGNLTYEQIMNYKVHERVAILGVNNFKELYEQYPDYLRPVEKRHLANIGKIVLCREDALQYTAGEKSINLNDYLMDYDLDRRMELLDVDDYTEMCKLYPEYVTDEEFEDLLEKGQINSVDDVIEFRGRFYENEHSEEWEEFEYEWDKEHRR